MAIDGSAVVEVIKASRFDERASGKTLAPFVSYAPVVTSILMKNLIQSLCEYDFTGRA